MKIPQRLLDEVRTLNAQHQQRLFDIVNIAVIALDLPVGCQFNFEDGTITVPETSVESTQIPERTEEVATGKYGSPNKAATLHTNQGNAVGMPMGKPGGKLMNMTKPTSGGTPTGLKGGPATPKGNGQPKVGGLKK